MISIAAVLAVAWSYPPGALPQWALKRACAYREEAGLNVQYDGRFALPPREAVFRKGNEVISVNASYTHGLPCVRGVGYEVQADDGSWSSCDVYESWNDLPPHRAGFRPHLMIPKFRDGLWDAGREVVAYVKFRASQRPRFAVGESVAEARNDAPNGYEQTCLAEATEDPNVWRSHAPLAFRYVRVLTDVEDVSLVLDEAERTAISPYAGGTAREREIWRVSAETLRLCTRCFYVDAVKRDRLPWAGDLCVNLLASAASFRDAETVRNSLDALDSAGPEGGEVNAIVDYSDWWVICHWLYRTQFGDLSFARSRWQQIRRRTNALLRLADADGLISGTNAWLFIDHGVDGCQDLGPRTTPLNILQFAALERAADLADELGETVDGARWHAQSRQIRKAIRDKAFDSVRRMFRSDVYNRSSPFLRHGNFFAVLFGVAEQDECAGIAAELAKDEMPSVGTVWMSAIEGVALILNGQGEVVRRRIERIWGGMLDRGATTFWEQWQPDAKGDAIYAFYERPFGLALCHSTATGPLFLLPMLDDKQPVNPFALRKQITNDQTTNPKTKE